MKHEGMAWNHATTKTPPSTLCLQKPTWTYRNLLHKLLVKCLGVVTEQRKIGSNNEFHPRVLEGGFLIVEVLEGFHDAVPKRLCFFEGGFGLRIVELGTILRREP